MRALITGVTGQDGGFLASHLLDMGYEVYGLVRRSSTADSLDRMHQRTAGRVKHVWGDVSDYSSVAAAMSTVKPDRVYNLAAQSHVGVSFANPAYTSMVNATGTLNVLEAARHFNPDCRVYQASTSELFGSTPPPQSELSVMHPRSPYGVAKLHGYWSVINARESYGQFASNGILFNHESEYRGYDFVTRKITRGVARIKLGRDKEIRLGNLSAQRDWGYAGDYVKAMHLILEHDTPGDYVVATGRMHSVREFVSAAFAAAGISIVTNGMSGLDEAFVEVSTGRLVVVVDPSFYRPAEVNGLCGSYDKIHKTLGWQPDTTFEEMVSLMVENDLEIEARNARSR
jgi:GDPmannose 4,6-dehydratase